MALSAIECVEGTPMEMTTAQNIRIEFEVAPNENGQCVQHGLWTEFYPNKMIRLRTTYVYGNIVGKLEQWFQSGQKNRSGFYDKNGNETGWWITYYKNGLPQLAGHYRDGKQFGRWSVWRLTGKLSSTSEWMNGKLHGLLINYHYNGIISIKGQMVNGNRRGIWKWWSPQGNLIKIKDFK